MNHAQQAVLWSAAGSLAGYLISKSMNTNPALTMIAASTLASVLVHSHDEKPKMNLGPYAQR